MFRHCDWLPNIEDNNEMTIGVHCGSSPLLFVATEGIPDVLQPVADMI